MGSNYFKIILRNIKRHKIYSFINIMGLAIGMACCILLLLHIRSELSFDSYHQNADRIHRLCAYVNIGGKEEYGGQSNATAAEVLRKGFPEIVNTVRFRYTPGSTVKFEDKLFFENNIYYADDTVFDIFSWPLTKGNPQTALNSPYSIVISEELAEKYFGTEDPLGKILNFNDQENYQVTGVMENIPQNSHFVFDALCSFKTLYVQGKEMSFILRDWLSYNFMTYLLLDKGADYQEVNKKIRNLLEIHAGNQMEAKGAKEELFLLPLKDIYLRPVWQTTGPILYVYIFSVIALFVLLIACVNFMNLSTARSANRAKEVGMRKVLGAERKKLIAQFLGESFFLSFLSLCIALFLVDLALPVINALSGQSLSLDFVEIPWLIPGFLGLAAFTGLIAGSYPALYLSAFHPVKVLKGSLKSASANSRLRRILVVFQFSISITLIIGTGIIIKQLNHMKHEDPGFNKEHVLVLPLTDSAVRDSIPVIKKEFRQHPGVIHVAASSTIPGWWPPSGDKIPEGYTQAQMQLMDELNVDEDFIPLMGIEVIAGRNFSREFGTDNRNSVIINETAARRYGWTNPLGKTIKTFDPKRTDPSEPGWISKSVIGVVKDFHLRYLSQVIEPLFIQSDPDFPIPHGVLDLMLVRINPEKMSDTLRFLEKKWAEIAPSSAFDPFYLDDAFNAQFINMERSRGVFSYFTFLAIFIGCLGLFGMASFTTEQRTKEIGIRKVLGSSVANIVFLLSKELMGSVLLANAIAWPLAYIMLRNWIQDFPYRTDINILIFVASAGFVFVIGLATISYRAVKAALANPADSLRYE